MVSISNRHRHLYVQKERTLPSNFMQRYNLTRYIAGIPSSQEALNRFTLENYEHCDLTKLIPEFPLGLIENAKIITKYSHLVNRFEQLKLCLNNPNALYTCEERSSLQHEFDTLKKIIDHMTPKKAQEVVRQTPNSLDIFAQELAKRAFSDVMLGDAIPFEAVVKGNLPFVRTETYYEKHVVHKKNRLKELNKILSEQMALNAKKKQAERMAKKAVQAEPVQLTTRLSKLVNQGHATILKAFRTVLSKAALL